MIAKINLCSHLVLEFSLLWEVFVTDSIFLLLLVYVGFLFFSWFILGRLYASRNSSISYKLTKLSIIVYNSPLWCFYDISCKVFIFISDFESFFPTSLAKDLLVFFILRKQLSFVNTSYFTYLCSNHDYFLLSVNLCLVYSFSSSLRCSHWRCFSFLKCVFLSLCSCPPLVLVFAVFPKFWQVVFSF